MSFQGLIEKQRVNESDITLDDVVSLEAIDYQRWVLWCAMRNLLDRSAMEQRNAHRTLKAIHPYQVHEGSSSNKS